MAKRIVTDSSGRSVNVSQAVSAPPTTNAADLTGGTLAPERLPADANLRPTNTGNFSPATGAPGVALVGVLPRFVAGRSGDVYDYTVLSDGGNPVLLRKNGDATSDAVTQRLAVDNGDYLQPVVTLPDWGMADTVRVRTQGREHTWAVSTRADPTANTQASFLPGVGYFKNDFSTAAAIGDEIGEWRDLRTGRRFRGNGSHGVILYITGLELGPANPFGNYLAMSTTDFPHTSLSWTVVAVFRIHPDRTDVDTTLLSNPNNYNIGAQLTGNTVASYWGSGTNVPAVPLPVKGQPFGVAVRFDGSTGTLATKVHTNAWQVMGVGVPNPVGPGVNPWDVGRPDWTDLGILSWDGWLTAIPDQQVADTFTQRGVTP